MSESSRRSYRLMVWVEGVSRYGDGKHMPPCEELEVHAFTAADALVQVQFTVKQNYGDRYFQVWGIDPIWIENP